MRNKPVQDSRRPSTGAASRIYSRDNVARYSERARQRRRGKRIRRVILVTVLGLLACVGTAAGLWVSRIAGNLNNSSVITNNLLMTLVDTDVARDPFYMLLLGTDGRPGEETYRSDSIILARIDPTEKKVALVSIPRDTRVEYNGSTMKINATHAYDGAEGVVKAVNELCGIEISHYAEINFEGMEALIDAVGGIDINATDGVDDPAHLDIVIEPGYQHMDGATALTYARARYQYIDGDYTRMRHQRQVLSALANKMLNEMDVTNIVDIIDSLSNMVITDLSIQDIVTLVNAMRGMDTDEIWSANLPSWAGEDTYVDGQSYVFVHEEALAEMMERMDDGKDPQGPQSMGTGGEGSTTTGDLANNSSEDWVYGEATTSSDLEDESEGTESESDVGESSLETE
ncbi:LCP family protein [Collinsella tanakaei]|uniref:LCP family protein n=1 Tax=Collinsella tanakaei TaxID=626935 RepID=UPI0025A47640|nr:LCP family protein [Collinsella tanakaei]MDM8300973.1 LCP family protein [Collinsella tanakaei]